MISSKILVQSAATGLVAGAILAAPFVLFCTGSDEVARPLCVGHNHAAPIEAPPALVAFESPQLRTAPPSAPTAVRQPSRSLAERNRAARQMLGQLNEAYGEGAARHAGTRAGAEIASQGHARQLAAWIAISAQMRSRAHHAADNVASSAKYIVRPAPR